MERGYWKRKIVSSKPLSKRRAPAFTRANGAFTRENAAFSRANGAFAQANLPVSYGNHWDFRENNTSVAKEPRKGGNMPPYIPTKDAEFGKGPWSVVIP
jgi:hypothetical protein